MHIESFFDPATCTISHLVMDSGTRQCALIDSVLDFDPKSGRTAHTSADRLVERVQALDGKVQWILETHVHADHLSAAPYLQGLLGGKIGIGQHIVAVQQRFGALFNTDQGFARNGRQFDHLFADGEPFWIGALAAHALHTPGHTPACMSYVVSATAEAGAPSAVFVGDTLFMPDYGTARCDFPGGDARTLYRSIARLLQLPADTPLYMCHDYQPHGRALQVVSSVAEQLAANIHIRQGISEAEFVAMRQARDATLDMPALLFAAVQVNMQAGLLPPPEANGTRYLKIPLNAV